jgi:hypothetical protein
VKSGISASYSVASYYLTLFKMYAMTELTVNIPDSKLPFFIQLAKELDFVVVDKKSTRKKLSAKQQKWVKGLSDALNEVEAHASGKKNLKTAQQLLNQL